MLLSVCAAQVAFGQAVMPPGREGEVAHMLETDAASEGALRDIRIDRDQIEARYRCRGGTALPANAWADRRVGFRHAAAADAELDPLMRASADGDGIRWVTGLHGVAVARAPSVPDTERRVVLTWCPDHGPSFHAHAEMLTPSDER